MEFKCSGCNYISANKHCVLKHINKINKCNKNIKLSILNIETDIVCKYCHKHYNTKPSMERHQKTCKVNKISAEYKLEVEKQKNKNLKKEVKILKIIANKPNIENQNNQINIHLTNLDNSYLLYDLVNI